MPRKSTLDAQRANIKKQYRRGAKAERRIVGVESLSDVELAVAKTKACYLKAADFSYTYIGEALSVSKNVVKEWFKDPLMHEEVAKIQADYVDGAVKLLKTYAVELVEIVVEIARWSEDEGIALKAALEGLDRIGLAKVNKSESAVAKTNRTEVDIVDKNGIVESLRDAPPDVQVKVAQKMEELLALTAEHTDQAVTHG